ncbi:MAG: hypothetical protein U1A25_00950 [Candidatus Sungbacteria bacterium]|nr:hypothetical protein [bacterium]MDZ4260207.1 hypothetical protein [Candidatus Sungbacteria bacterium]
MRRINRKLILGCVIGTVAGLLIFINEIVKQDITKLGLISVALAGICGIILWAHLSPEVPPDDM